MSFARIRDSGRGISFEVRNGQPSKNIRANTLALSLNSSDAWVIERVEVTHAIVLTKLFPLLLLLLGTNAQWLMMTLSPALKAVTPCSIRISFVLSAG